ncbi:DUF6173 family protein [Paenibacillus sp. TAF58]
MDFKNGFNLPDALKGTGFKVPSTAEFRSPQDILGGSMAAILPAGNPNNASEFHKRLVQMINDFDDVLDPEHEVGMRLVSFGQTIVFHVENLGYWNPSLIRFYGRTEKGDPVELIQHVSQISFLLMKVKRLDPSQPKKKLKIGFTADEEKEEESAE